MALRTAAQPASPAGKRPPPPKPLGFKALAPGERCGSPCPRLVHDPLHRRLEHAQATAQVALADHTLDDPWAGKEPKSRPLALPVGKKGRRPVAVNPWARATRQPQRSVQGRQASRGQGHWLSGKQLPLAKPRRQPKPAQVNSSPPAKLRLRVRRCETDNGTLAALS